MKMKKLTILTRMAHRSIRHLKIQTQTPQFDRSTGDPADC
jgi:hypothetical protein